MSGEKQLASDLTWAAVLGAMMFMFLALISESYAQNLDITRHGRYTVFAPDNTVYSEHNEIHVAYEKAGLCSIIHGVACLVEPPSYSVIMAGNGDCPACPDCPPVEVCPDPEPCPDCPDKPIPPPDPEFYDVTLAWTEPTTRENGKTISGIDPDALDFYTIEWWTGSSSKFTETVPAPASTYSFENFAVGAWEFRVKATDKEGLSSDWSNSVVTNIGDVCVPTKPANFVCERFEEGVLCTWDNLCSQVELWQYDVNYNPDLQQNGWTVYKLVPGKPGGHVIPNSDLFDSMPIEGGGQQSGYKVRGELDGNYSGYAAEQWIDRVHRGDPAVIETWLW